MAQVTYGAGPSGQLAAASSLISYQSGLCITDDSYLLVQPVCLECIALISPKMANLNNKYNNFYHERKLELRTFS